MLTKDQRNTFRLALSSLNNYLVEEIGELDIDDMLTDSQIVETAETVDDFFKAQGCKLNRKGERPEIPFEVRKSLCGDLYKWDDVQASKGKRRGSLYVMDMGDARATYFDGEV